MDDAQLKEHKKRDCLRNRVDKTRQAVQSIEAGVDIA